MRRTTEVLFPADLNTLAELPSLSSRLVLILGRPYDCTWPLYFSSRSYKFLTGKIL